MSIQVRGSCLAMRLLRALSAGWQPSDDPGLTRGELRHRIGAPSDTEITSRLRDLRRMASYGLFDVRVARAREDGDVTYRYSLPESERERAIQFLRERGFLNE